MEWNAYTCLYLLQQALNLPLLDIYLCRSDFLSSASSLLLFPFLDLFP